MMSVTTSGDSERRLAEAMRAQASGAGRPGFVGRNPGSIGGAPASTALPEPSSGLWSALLSSRLPLLLALLGGIVLGVALALLSLLAPGVLPTLG
jgi:hypothetical protein